MATGTFALHPSVFAQNMEGNVSANASIRLGVASYTFRAFERARLITFMQQLKNTCLNAKDVKDHLPMEASAEAVALEHYRAAGIRIHALGTVSFAKDEDEDMRAKFDYARRAGVSVIVAGDPTPQSLPRLERFVKEYDIRVGIHNHGPEDKLWPSPMDVLKAVGNMDKRLGCCIDVGHCVRAGTDVVQAIRAAGPRLFNMHVKDLTDFSAKESQVAVGQGKMPVREIFEALVKIGYPGFVDLEYEIHEDDPMPGVVESFAYMRGVLAGMGLAQREGSEA
jgi:sugar phosphate isomerase/epimerase